MLFIFDEPTTGLPFPRHIPSAGGVRRADPLKGHTIVVVEHNTEVIRCADWVVDLGPEAGSRRRQVVFEGTPRELAECAESHTGEFLRRKMP